MPGPVALERGRVVVDRYRVEDEIGRGHHGAVYRAVDLRLNTRIALKVSDGSGAASFSNFEARFRREAMIGYRLGRQTGFVSAFDWGRLEERVLYLAMDLVPGARPLELHKGERSRRLGPLLDAARLVAEAHARGVIHRDLKPSNFLVDRHGQVHIADFGLAKIIEEDEEAVAETTSLTQTNTALGTCVFMSPEQFENAKQADAQSDVFSLGVMLYLALTGKLPYPGKNGTQVFKKLMMVRHGRAKPADPRAHDPSTISLALGRVCTRALEIDRAKRTRTAEGFVSGLERALGKMGQPRPVSRILVTANDPNEAIVPITPKSTAKGPATVKAIKKPQGLTSMTMQAPKPVKPPATAEQPPMLTPWQQFKQDSGSP